MTEPILPPKDAHPSVLDQPAPKPTQASKIANKIIIAALVVIALAIGTMFYWATASDKVLDIKNAPFPVRTIREHPTAGGVIIMTVDYCKLTDTVGDLRMSFVSPTREIFLPVNKERGPKGCNKTEIPVLIPKDIPADSYKVKFRVTYDINPLKQNVIQEFESQSVVIDESNVDPNAASVIPESVIKQLGQ